MQGNEEAPQADEAKQAEAKEAKQFEPITSQDQLDRLIGGRIERERSKFSDYEDLRKKASELDELRESSKSEADKMADRLAKAEEEAKAVPSKVTEALRQHLVDLHEIDEDTAELFLTANDPQLLLRQVKALQDQQEKKARTPRPNAAINGGDPKAPGGDWLRDQLTTKN